MNWIAIDDAVGVVHHALMTESLAGPVNAVAPHVVANQEFTWTLGGVLSRPTALSVPAFALRMAYGDMAEETMLASTRVVPKRLQESAYPFRHPELEGALRHVLGRVRTDAS